MKITKEALGNLILEELQRLDEKPKPAAKRQKRREDKAKRRKARQAGQQAKKAGQKAKEKMFPLFPLPGTGLASHTCGSHRLHRGTGRAGGSPPPGKNE